MKKFIPSIAIAGLLLASGAVFAGPLTPPPGAVAGTGKTLTEVEPRTSLSQATTPGDVANQFKISQPGSYYLAADVSASPGANPCILITASDVTLDLNGFSVRAAAAEGIRIAGDRVTIRNGSVALAPGSADGIYVLTGAGDVRLLGLNVSAPASCVRAQNGVGNISLRDSTLVGGQHGFYLSGQDTVASLVGVECRGQSHDGLSLGSRATVEGCTVSGIGSSGGLSASAIYVGDLSVIRNTSILDSAAIAGTGPDWGLQIGVGVTVDNCTVYSRGTIGIRSSGSATVRHCTVTMGNTGNTGLFDSSGHSTIEDNTITAPTGSCIALSLGTGSSVVRNHLMRAALAISGNSLSSNIIGPAAGNGNPTASTNPHANLVN